MPRCRIALFVIVCTLRQEQAEHEAEGEGRSTAETAKKQAVGPIARTFRKTDHSAGGGKNMESLPLGKPRLGRAATTTIKAPAPFALVCSVP